MILFTSCECPSLERVLQFPTDSEQTIIISRKTDVSRGTGMCINIRFNLYMHDIARVKYMCISSGIYSRVYNIYRGEWAAIREVKSAVFSFHYVLHAVILNDFFFWWRGFESRVDQYIFILYNWITRFSCENSNINCPLNLKYAYQSIHVLRCTIILQCTCIYVHMIKMRAQFILCKYILPRSKCYSSKTC